MRAKEFITEREMPKPVSRAMSTSYHFPTMPSSDAYQAYRFGLAMADHKTHNKYGPAAQHAVIVAYTTEEDEIIKGAERETGHRGKLLTDRGSRESQNTETQSPVAKSKRNRYGV
jgi:hypothetical protein